MNCRSMRGLFILMASSVTPPLFAQCDPQDSKPALFRVEPSFSESSSNTFMRPVEKASIQPRLTFRSQHGAKRFVILSTAVYAAGFADMHQTLQRRKSPWWYETDPLARPFARLPAPAYYATGLAMATGINWLSWKMAHSRRWHKLAPIPQVLAITGNLYGLHSNSR